MERILTLKQTPNIITIGDQKNLDTVICQFRLNCENQVKSSQYKMIIV